MSSHHIIRDEQEPGLIILEYEPEYQPMLDALLEWTPIVIASEAIIEKVLPLNFKIDLVIGTIEPDFLNDAYQPIRFLSINNTSLIETALHFFIAKKQTTINVLASESEIPDLFRLVNESPLCDGVLISFFTHRSKITIVSRESYSKWLKEGSTVIIHNFNTETRFSLSENLEEKGVITDQKNLLTVKNSGLVNISGSNTFLVEEIIFNA